jgi:hypothetical protein
MRESPPSLPATFSMLVLRLSISSAIQKRSPATPKSIPTTPAFPRSFCPVGSRRRGTSKLGGRAAIALASGCVCGRPGCWGLLLLAPLLLLIRIWKIMEPLMRPRIGSGCLATNYFGRAAASTIWRSFRPRRGRRRPPTRKGQFILVKRQCPLQPPLRPKRSRRALRNDGKRATADAWPA